MDYSLEILFVILKIYFFKGGGIFFKGHSGYLQKYRNIILLLHRYYTSREKRLPRVIF